MPAPTPMAPPPEQPPRAEELQHREEGSPRAPHSDLDEVQRRICERLRRTGRHDNALGSPSFDGRLARHLRRLPRRYLTDNLADDRAEDVLLHWRILDDCADPDKRLIFHARFVRAVHRTPDIGSDQELDDPCQRMMENLRQEPSSTFVDAETIFFHEIIFSTVDKPKLLHRLTGLLAEVGLNIRQAHVYTTIDGFCLGVFVVDGWETEDTGDLIAVIKKTLTTRSSPPSH